jgi:hypothetical protein
MKLEVLGLLVICMLLAACAGNGTQLNYEVTRFAQDTLCSDASMSAVYTATGNACVGSAYCSYINSLYEKAAKRAGDNTLTDRELIRLGVWEDEERFEHSLRTLAMMIYRFYSSEGRVPADANEVINVLGNSPNILGNLYNPISGKLYSGFTAKNWCSNEIYVEVTLDPAEAKTTLARLYPEVKTEFDSWAYPEPTCAIRLVIYGEKPGSVIFDDYFF